MSQAHRHAASSAAPALPQTRRVAPKTAAGSAAATTESPDERAAAERLQPLWAELRATIPELRAAHYSPLLLEAAVAAVNRGLGKQQAATMPDAERVALRALLPTGGRVERLLVWTHRLHQLQELVALSVPIVFTGGGASG